MHENDRRPTDETNWFPNVRRESDCWPTATYSHHASWPKDLAPSPIDSVSTKAIGPAGSRAEDNWPEEDFDEVHCHPKVVPKPARSVGKGKRSQASPRLPDRLQHRSPDRASNCDPRTKPTTRPIVLETWRAFRSSPRSIDARGSDRREPGHWPQGFAGRSNRAEMRCERST